jgi:hypothetical protein
MAILALEKSKNHCSLNLMYLNKCLFCVTMSNSFVSESHIIPESLGNKEYMLPKGVVCDKCNIYFGGELETYFCNHHLSVGLKPFYLDKTKKRKPPQIPLIKGEMRRDANGKVKITQEILPDKEGSQFVLIFRGEEIQLYAQYFREPVDTGKLSRYLAKMGLEILYYKNKDLVFDQEFNFIRNYTRYGGRNFYVPFMWKAKQVNSFDLKLVTLTSKKRGIFYFSKMDLPGCSYFIPLNRNSESHGFDHLSKKLGMKIFDTKTFVSVEPAVLDARFGPSK